MQPSGPDKSSIEGISLVLGGARSGKSAFAEKLLNDDDRRKIYLATGQAFDDEMDDRIAHHQARRGADWHLIEEPLGIATAIRNHAKPDCSLLLDCLTLWVTNLMMAERNVETETAELCKALSEVTSGSNVMLVSNEVGQGIVPIDPMARAFRDHAGRLHQQVASLADQVWFVTAGLPQRLK